MTPVLTVADIRLQFPQLSVPMNGKPLIYLDNGATTQKPWAVINRLTQFYSQEYGTIHRGVYALSQAATDAFEASRDVVQAFLNAKHNHEIIFTRGTTESINLVARSFGSLLKPGSEIMLSELEHHANIVPWQLIAQEKNLVIKVIPINDKGELIMETFESLLSDKTALVAVNHISNALGTINPVAEIIKKAHAVGAKVLIDGAQSVSHMPVDVQALDCDFYCFSSHKVFGPTGVGILYGKTELLDAMPPYQSGGDMIESVTFEKTTFAPLPSKFEAGTPAIAEIIALSDALHMVKNTGFDFIQRQEHALLEAAHEALSEVPGLRIIGQAKEKASVVSFVIQGIHPHDLGTILDEEGIAIRAGHHCAQPIMNRFKVPATARASFSFYNTVEEVAVLAKALHKARDIML